MMQLTVRNFRFIPLRNDFSFKMTAAVEERNSDVGNNQNTALFVGGNAISGESINIK
jgi:hypothetical protein